MRRSSCWRPVATRRPTWMTMPDALERAHRGGGRCGSWWSSAGCGSAGTCSPGAAARSNDSATERSEWQHSAPGPTWSGRQRDLNCSRKSADSCRMGGSAGLPIALGFLVGIVPFALWTCWMLWLDQRARAAEFVAVPQGTRAETPAPGTHRAIRRSQCRLRLSGRRSGRLHAVRRGSDLHRVGPGREAAMASRSNRRLSPPNSRAGTEQSAYRHHLWNIRRSTPSR